MKAKTLNNTYLSMLCSELAMLLDAGLTLSDSVQVISEDEPGKDAKALMQTLYDSLMLGSQFSVALKRRCVVLDCHSVLQGSCNAVPTRYFALLSC